MSLRSRQNGVKLGSSNGKHGETGNELRTANGDWSAPSLTRTGPTMSQRRGTAEMGTGAAGISSAPPLIPIALAAVRSDRHNGHYMADASPRAGPTTSAALYYMDGPCTIAEVAPPHLTSTSTRGPSWMAPHSPRPRTNADMGLPTPVATPRTAPYYVVPSTAAAPGAVRGAEDTYTLAEISENRRQRHLPPFAASTPNSVTATPETSGLEPYPLSACTRREAAGSGVTLPLVAGRACTPLSTSGHRPAPMSAVHPTRTAATPYNIATPTATTTTVPTSVTTARPSPPPPQARGAAQLRRAATPPLTVSRPSTVGVASRPGSMTVTTAEERCATTTTASAAGVPTLLLVNSLSTTPMPPRSRTARRPVRAAPVAAAATIVERSRASSVSTTRRRAGRTERTDATAPTATATTTRPASHKGLRQAMGEAAASGPAKTDATEMSVSSSERRRRSEDSANTSLDTAGHAQALKKHKHEQDMTRGTRDDAGRSSPAVTSQPADIPTTVTAVTRASRSGSEAATTSPIPFTPTSQQVGTDGGYGHDPRSLSSVRSTLTCTDITPMDRQESVRSSSASLSQVGPGAAAAAAMMMPHTPDKRLEGQSMPSYQHNYQQLSLPPAQASRLVDEPRTPNMDGRPVPTGMPTPEKRSDAAAAAATETLGQRLQRTVVGSAAPAPPPPPQQPQTNASQSPARTAGPAPTRITPQKAPPAGRAVPTPQRERTTTATTTRSTTPRTTRANGTTNGNGSKASATKGSSGSRPGHPTTTTTATTTTAATTTTTGKPDSQKWMQLKERRRRELYAWNEYLRNQKEVVVGDAV